MIPKKIHYCWFGGKEKPEDVKKYIASWKKYCPDYEIKEWNESNFDIHENDYCREAYEAKKWAFVTDYVRLKALYEEGGFYMDSGNEWIGMLIHNYDHRHFLRKDGTCDTTTNVIVITDLTVKKYGLHLHGQKLLFGHNMALLPFDYLCAKDLDTGEICKTSNTYTIHHFAASWLPEDERNYSRLYKKYDADFRRNGMNPKLSHYASRIRAAYEIGGISMIFRRLFID